jgi:formiminotetrahydrofolate cyclodeaminase
MLVDEDAEAYRRALEARAAADETEKPERRDWALGQVTAAAAEPPLALSRLAADVAELCAAAGARVEPRVHADVAAAAALAAAVARGARELVAVNLTALPGDARVEEADRLAAAAGAAAASVQIG